MATTNATKEKGLLGLPRELLLKIRSHIHSLSGLVSYSLTCKTIKNLYDDNYWRFALVSSGWGRPELSSKTTKAIKGKDVQLWAGLARVVVKDAKTFATNKEIPKWADIDTIYETDLRDENKLRAKTAKELKTDKIKLKVAEQAWTNCDWEKKEKDMFTVPDYDGDDYPGPKLHEHPFVANRFLTKPHLTRILVNDGKTEVMVPVENQGGVTYWEACLQMAKRLAKLPKHYKSNTDHSFFEGFALAGGCLSVCWGS